MASNPNSMPHDVRTVLAELGGVSTRTIANWRRLGLPLTADLRPSPETLAWMARKNRVAPEGGGEDALPTEQESRIRLNLAREAESLTRNREREGELVERGAVIARLRSALTTIRSRLLEVPVRAAARGFGSRTESDLRSVVDDEVRTALDSLSEPESYAEPD